MSNKNKLSITYNKFCNFIQHNKKVKNRKQLGRVESLRCNGKENALNIIKKRYTSDSMKSYTNSKYNIESNIECAFFYDKTGNKFDIVKDGKIIYY